MSRHARGTMIDHLDRRPESERERIGIDPATVNKELKTAVTGLPLRPSRRLTCLCNAVRPIAIPGSAVPGIGDVGMTAAAGELSLLPAGCLTHRQAEEVWKRFTDTPALTEQH